MFPFRGIQYVLFFVFTALNNGLMSAISSFARTLVFQIACIFVLPIWLGLNGIWLSTVVAEALTLILSAVLFVANNKNTVTYRQKASA